MDVLDQHLSNAQLNKDYRPCLRLGVTMGKQTLNRYYCKTDDAYAYRIAMSMSSSFPTLHELITFSQSSIPVTSSNTFVA